MNARTLPLVALLGALALEATPAAAAPWDKPGYALTFQDEFDGGSLDLSKWQRRYKWGEAVINGELQAYIDDAFVVQSGLLSIVGNKAPGQYAGQSFAYTSGVICSVHEQTYGYFEARLKVPKGQGLWPAFWLLGAVGTTGVNEIDVMELLGHEPTKAYMTVHWGPSYGAGHQSDGSDFSGPDFSADFHTFGLAWDADKIVWSIDGVDRKTHTGPGVPQVDMYLILNLAIGGGWPGAPDSTTSFPANYVIDYVRAYQRTPDAGAGGASGAGGGAGAGGSAGAGAGTGGTSTGGAGATTSGGSGGSGATGNGGATGKGGADGGTGKGSDDSGGCGCRAAGSTRGAWAWLTLLFAFSLARRRRSA